MIRKKYTITFTDKFSRSQNVQYDWPLKNHGLKQTEAYFKSVDKTAKALAYNPKLHHELKDGLRMAPIKSAYILYKINDEKKQVEIIDFIAQHRVYEFSQEP